MIRSNINEIIVRIIDDNDALIAEKEISIAKGKRYDDINIGVLSDDFEIFLYNYKSNEWESYSKETLLIDEVDNVYYDEEEGTKIKLNSKGKSGLRSPSFSIKGVIK